MPAYAPPAGFVERLRRSIGEETITVEWDPVATAKKGLLCWNVLYLERGMPTWICEWQGPLDGAHDGLCQRIAKYDYARHENPRYYAQKLDAKMQMLRDERKRQRMDMWRDYADYSRKAFQAHIDGNPMVGSRRRDVSLGTAHRNHVRTFGGG